MALQHYPAHHHHDLLEEAFLADIGFGYYSETPPSYAAPSQSNLVVTSPENDTSSGGTVVSACGAGEDDRGGDRYRDGRPGDDDRRLRRKISNRESARRSRARKQRHLDEQRAAAALLRASNRDLAARLRDARARAALVALANARLRSEGQALGRRLAAARRTLALMQLYAAYGSTPADSAVHGGDGLRLPPGPWQLPVIGSLHHLAWQLPHRAMRDLARRHGPAMLLRLGEVPTLVVSSREGAREVMKTHDTTFATRPLSATMRVITNSGRDIVFAPYGDYWRQLRKIAVTELFAARRVLSFRAIREEEVAAVLREVGEAAAAEHPVVEMHALLSALVADSTVRAVMGDRCKERDAFLRELDRSMNLAAGFNPADLWPSSRLAVRLSGAVRHAKECRDAVYGILDGIIQEHLKRMDSGTDQDDDLLDVLLRIQKEGGLQFPLDMDAIKSVIFDIFGAGSETAATTLEWAMAELIKNPKVMEKATAEVRQAFQSRSAVSEHALSNLHYLHLVIRETLRLHTPLPLLLPRECQEPCQVLGYDVPRGTQVLINVWALGRDERYWPDAPEEFRPERFESEAAAADFGGNDFTFLPFGAGRRMCPGMAFGLANVELPLASLLFHFDWELPSSTELDMGEAFGLTARRRAKLLLRPILQVPVPGV